MAIEYEILYEEEYKSERNDIPGLKYFKNEDGDEVVMLSLWDYKVDVKVTKENETKVFMLIFQSICRYDYCKSSKSTERADIKLNVYKKEFSNFAEFTNNDDSIISELYWIAKKRAKARLDSLILRKCKQRIL
jgi:hypothetical protein